MNANQALGASKVYTNQVALGLSNISINDATGTVTFELNDGSSASWTFPVPTNGADGVSVTGVEINASNHLICTLSDETTIDCGALPTSGGSGSGGTIGQGSLATMSGDVIPSAPSSYSIGSESRKLKAVYADEVFISKNTLYIDGTPVFSKDNTNDILVSADENQSVKVSTKGVATTGILSEGAVEIATTKEASNINIKSGDITSGTSSNVNVSASNNISEIANNQITLKAPNIKFEGATSVVGGLNVDSLNVSGNVTVSGESFIVEAESVEVKDNIMVLNKGEVGTGVTKGTSGIKIDRGDAVDYELVFDEADDMFKIGAIDNLETIATREYVNTTLEGYVDKENIDSYLTEYAKKTDIPTSGGGNNYSTEETVCGTWVDGKPIYRKCGYCSSNGVLSPNATSVIPVSWANSTNLPNVKNIVSAKIAQDGSSLLALRTLAPIQTSDGITVVWNYSNGYGFDTTTMIVLEYTKTTD